MDPAGHRTSVAESRGLQQGDRIRTATVLRKRDHDYTPVKLGVESAAGDPESQTESETTDSEATPEATDADATP